MDSIRFGTFLLASLASHAALLVSLSGVIPAVLDSSELEADTVTLSIRVSPSAPKSDRRSEESEPYQAIENVAMPRRLEQETERAEQSKTAATASVAQPPAPNLAAAAKVESPTNRESTQQQLTADDGGGTPLASSPDATADPDLRQSAATEVNKRRQQAAEERYLTELLRAVARHRSYPAHARNRGQQGRVEVNLTILRNGEFQSIAVSKPSSFRTLNKASTRTLSRLKRFKPFPADIDRQSWQISIPFRYVLHARKDNQS